MVSGEGGRLWEGDDSREIPGSFDWAGKSAESEGLGEDGEDAEEGPEDKYGVFKALRLACAWWW